MVSDLVPIGKETVNSCSARGPCRRSPRTRMARHDGDKPALALGGHRQGVGMARPRKRLHYRLWDRRKSKPDVSCQILTNRSSFARIMILKVLLNCGY
jgi:hypothetical protein